MKKRCGTFNSNAYHLLSVLHASHGERVDPGSLIERYAGNFIVHPSCNDFVSGTGSGGAGKSSNKNTENAFQLEKFVFCFILMDCNREKKSLKLFY